MDIPVASEIKLENELGYSLSRIRVNARPLPATVAHELLGLPLPFLLFYLIYNKHLGKLF